MPLFDNRKVDTAGEAAVFNASIKEDYEPILWFTTSKWYGESILTVIKYRLKSNKNGEIFEMEFTFSVPELLRIFSAEAMESPFAMVNSMRMISKERESLKMQMESATKMCSTKWDELGDSIGKFEKLKGTLSTIAAYDSLIWLMRKPKGWRDFLKMVERYQTNSNVAASS